MSSSLIICDDDFDNGRRCSMCVLNVVVRTFYVRQHLYKDNSLIRIKILICVSTFFIFLFKNIFKHLKECMKNIFFSFGEMYTHLRQQFGNQQCLERSRSKEVSGSHIWSWSQTVDFSPCPSKLSVKECLFYRLFFAGLGHHLFPTRDW